MNIHFETSVTHIIDFVTVHWTIKDLSPLLIYDKNLCLQSSKFNCNYLGMCEFQYNLTSGRITFNLYCEEKIAKLRIRIAVYHYEELMYTLALTNFEILKPIISEKIITLQQLYDKNPGMKEIKIIITIEVLCYL